MSELTDRYLSRLRVRVGGVLYRGVYELERLTPILKEGVLSVATENLRTLEASSRFYDLDGQRVEIWYKSTRNARRAEMRERARNRKYRWGP